MLLPDFDFETYSEAGYEWSGAKWQRLKGAAKYGLPVVGSRVYAEHPSTEILMLAYDLHDGQGTRQWLQGMAPPTELFEYFASGGIMSAVNDTFEFENWQHVAVPKLGWPPIKRRQLRDVAAKARAYGLPGSLANMGAVLNADVQKDKDGKRLMDKFSMPRQPTKGDPRTRILPTDDLTEYMAYCSYNVDDVRAETVCSRLIPDLEGDELEFQLLTAEMNYRGMAIDMPSVQACIDTLEREYERCNTQLCEVTGGAVESATQGQRMIGWLAAQGVKTTSLDAEHRAELVARPWPPHMQHVAKALHLYDLITGAGVKKVYTMQRMANSEGRLCNLYMYHGAGTGRDTGQDAQPQNLVKAGHPLRECVEGCGAGPLMPDAYDCPQCDSPTKPTGWSWEAADWTLQIIRDGRAHEVFDSPVLAVSGCIRSLFVAGPGKELICSDYSSIEAVVTACLAGEQWRIDAFKRGDDIYLTSAAAIRGTTLDWYMANGGKSHPDRQKIGKPAELGLGFGGWIGAWRQFDKSGQFNDDEVKDLIIKWRDASPNIVEFWGGQCRGKPWAPTCWERYGLEGAAINAVEFVGQVFTVGRISFQVREDILFCKLPSGRERAYWRPRLAPSDRWEGHLALSYEGWNSNPKKGAPGWQRMELYGGLLCENVVQATARDLLRSGVIALEHAGYPIVLRVHDEIAAEVPEGWGSIEEFERLMATIPHWAEGWPIKASGGWRGKRYRKE